ncbi:MAG: O-antigen ligase family protein [Clostridiales bacterium]|nr:O-antigen ligase family protein [Clostridiales bacterium]
MQEVTQKTSISYQQTPQASKTKKAHSPSYILAVGGMLYACGHKLLENIFKNTSVDLTFTVVSITAMIIYQLYVLLIYRRYKYGNLLLAGLLCIFYFAALYLILFSGFVYELYICSILLALLVFKQYKLTDREKTRIYWLFVIMTIILLMGGTTKDMMSEDKVNPNTCGLLLMLLFCMSIVRYRNTKGLLDLILILLSFGLQFYYQSRTAIVGCFCFIILMLIWGRRQYCSTKSACILILFLSLLSVLFAYLYVQYLMGLGQESVIKKDLFTGRPNIWKLAFESIEKHIWFGVGSHFNEDLAVIWNNKALLNTHNQSLGIITSFGVIAFVIFSLVFAYLVSQSCVVNEKCKKKTTYRLPIIFIVSILIMNFAETNFFYPWYVAILAAFVFISNSCEKKTASKYINKNEKTENLNG